MFFLQSTAYATITQNIIGDRGFECARSQRILIAEERFSRPLRNDEVGVGILSL